VPNGVAAIVGEDLSGSLSVVVVDVEDPNQVVACIKSFGEVTQRVLLLALLKEAEDLGAKSLVAIYVELFVGGTRIGLSTDHFDLVPCSRERPGDICEARWRRNTDNLVPLEGIVDIGHLGSSFRSVVTGWSTILHPHRSIFPQDGTFETKLLSSLPIA